MGMFLELFKLKFKILAAKTMGKKLKMGWDMYLQWADQGFKL